MPLANALLTREQLSLPEETFPLDLVFCPNCTLVQITETVSPEKLFREYLYFSSFSETVLENARILADDIITRCTLNDKSLVLEIASNDGYLLQNYKQRGIPVLGVEPARNIASYALEKGIPTVSEFFDVRLAEQLKERGNSADVIHANNVVAHVADLQGVGGTSMVTEADGVAIIENHYTGI
jgi:2-polyprenyl-3-methyl-5-hydroxy-6-metoxy-1,4-benzoquinol methylase